MTVDLVYHPDCPNAGAARARLLEAFARLGQRPRWREWSADDPACPPYARGLASPAILVDGREVVPGPRGVAACRLAGPPDVEQIVAALRAHRPRTAWASIAAMLPAVGLALLPNVACPACWPAYAGVLGSLGLGFLLDGAYLLPLTALFLAVAVAALAFRARHRRGYRPFALGLAASVAVMGGKFGLDSDPMMYAGLAALVAASIWNSWPHRAAAPSCPSCAPGSGPERSSP